MEIEARLLYLNQRSMKDTPSQSEDSMGSSDLIMPPDMKMQRTSMHNYLAF